jgi:hypothetical protein
VATRIRVRYLAVVICLLVGAGTANAATTSGWRSYTNERWGYRIDVPKTLVSQPEPENGGGLAFFSQDGQVKLYTYGSYDVDGTPTIDEAQRDAEFDWIGSTGRVTYRATKPNWFVSTGISDKGRVFYQRYEQRGQGDSTCHVTFTISYTEKLKTRWNPLIDRMAKSFRVPSGDCQG